MQYLYWFHERGGRKRLIKTGRNATEPYVHEIDEVRNPFGQAAAAVAHLVDSPQKPPATEEVQLH